MKKLHSDYQAPQVEVMAVATEGLLCTSDKQGSYFENPNDEIIYGWEE